MADKNEIYVDEEEIDKAKGMLILRYSQRYGWEQVSQAELDHEADVTKLVDCDSWKYVIDGDKWWNRLVLNAWAGIVDKDEIELLAGLEL